MRLRAAGRDRAGLGDAGYCGTLAAHRLQPPVRTVCAAAALIQAPAAQREGRIGMHIKIGYELVYDCPQPTPMLLMLTVHHTRAADLVTPDGLVTDPPVPVHAYHDGFGNWCSRIVAPAGRTRLFAEGVVNDTGEPDPVTPG